MDWVERAREVLRRIPQTAWVLAAVGVSFIVIGIVTHFTAGADPAPMPSAMLTRVGSP